MVNIIELLYALLKLKQLRQNPRVVTQLLHTGKVELASIFSILLGAGAVVKFMMIYKEEWATTDVLENFQELERVWWCPIVLAELFRIAEVEFVSLA